MVFDRPFRFLAVVSTCFPVLTYFGCMTPSTEETLSAAAPFTGTPTQIINHIPPIPDECSICPTIDASCIIPDAGPSLPPLPFWPGDAGAYHDHGFVVVGDSREAGYGLPAAWMGYPELGAHSAGTRLWLSNDAKTGQTVADIDKYFATNTKTVIDGSPKPSALWLGGGINDLIHAGQVQATFDHKRSISAQARAAGESFIVWLGTLPSPIAATPGDVAKLNALEETCVNDGSCNLYIKPPPEFTGVAGWCQTDGTHEGPECAVILAREVERALAIWKLRCGC